MSSPNQIPEITFNSASPDEVEILTRLDHVISTDPETFLRATGRIARTVFPETGEEWDRRIEAERKVVEGTELFAFEICYQALRSRADGEIEFRDDVLHAIDNDNIYSHYKVERENLGTRNRPADKDRSLGLHMRIRALEVVAEQVKSALEAENTLKAS